MSDEAQAVLDVEGLRKTFRLPAGRFGGAGAELVAVTGVSFVLPEGGALAIVGESGSGKTTTARMLVGLERPDAGTIRFRGGERTQPPRGKDERRRRGREIQIVFQDPNTSLDPRQRVEECLEEVVRFHFDLPRDERRRHVQQLLEQVGLGGREHRALPRELSGGQRQRVAIARALAAQPSVLILDEAVSALDVSIQAQVLNLLADIRVATGVSYLVISHDLAVVRQITDEALVMYRGTIVERGPTAKILERPEHPYTRLLLDSIPHLGWEPERISAARQAFASPS